MILTDREMMIAIRCDQLIIDPVPPDTSFTSTSVDLTLADDGLEWTSTGGIQIRPGHNDYKYSNMAATFQRPVKVAGYVLKPTNFLLGWTRERIGLPTNSRLAARVEGKSSLARLGICVHLTAPTIHAGFDAPVQLEIVNFGPHEIVLNSGMRICQLIVEQILGTPHAGYAGQFMHQVP